MYIGQDYDVFFLMDVFSKTDVFVKKFRQKCLLSTAYFRHIHLYPMVGMFVNGRVFDRRIVEQEFCFFWNNI
jgi:hypothetical protein